MPNLKNKDNYYDLVKNIENAKSIVFANYSGLEVNQINNLRAKLDSANASAKVYKNTLIKKVLKEKMGTQILNETMAGPTLVITATQDAISPIKALFEYIKEFELPVVKLGFLGTEILSKEKIEELSKLPSKQQLLTKLVGTLNNPTTRLTKTLGNPSSKLVFALKAIAHK